MEVGCKQMLQLLLCVPASAVSAHSAEQLYFCYQYAAKLLPLCTSWHCSDMCCLSACAMQQVCTLSAGQLRDAAAGQLSAWVAQQHDLEVPAAGLNIELVSMPRW
jgi:hypothetical protein